MGILSEFATSDKVHDITLSPTLLLPQLAQLNRQTLLLAILILSATFFLRSGKKKQRHAPGVPIVGGDDKETLQANRQRFKHDGKSLLQEGYAQNKGNLFYVPSPLGERLMLPSRYLEDLKNAPTDKIDFVATFQEMFEGKYTTMGSRSQLHPRVSRTTLNQHLADVMPGVQEEISNAFQEDFPACDDWTEVPVVDRITQIVARVSSRMFGGTTLSEDKEWVKSSIGFALDGFEGAQAIKQYPEYLKPIAKHFIPALKKIDAHYRSAERAAIPLLEQRERDGEKAMDMLSWMADAANGEEKDNKFIASILLKVSFAAIHTSAAAPSQLIFDLCDMPEYIQPLREELEAALGEDGMIDKKSFNTLVKMDSIMKESQRFNPLLLITFERVVTEDYKLSDGFIIPGNTFIGLPAQAISMDPDLYKEPEKFDGWRFEKLRQEMNDKEAGKANFSSSNPNAMNFGYGRHACPGRFFAANEIKAIMGYLLMNYDMKFKEGQSRPKSMLFETQNLPDHEATVMFKRRK